VLVWLGHVDTVLAAPAGVGARSLVGDLADGFLWGRGALDMKSQVAAEAVAAASAGARRLAPARGALKLVFVSDEETGGDVGARWLTEQHPDKVRCDLLLNEGAGGVFECRGVRHYGVCCGEKGIFRFKLTAHGAAGHASLPRTGDNALLKLAPVLARSPSASPAYDLTEAPRRCSGLGEIPATRPAARAIASAAPGCRCCSSRCSG
jgi:acetylornithine deacetylase/succinyl-diaminopimelate desuccinylase-like protein